MSNTTIVHTDINEAVERLRASKAEAVAQDQADGLAAGRDWALHAATYRELECLERRVMTEGIDLQAEDDASAVLAACMAEVMGYEPTSSHAVESAKRDLFPSAFTVYPVEFVDGFIDGALAFWREVQTRI